MAVVELEIPARPAYLSLVRLIVDVAVGSLAPGLSVARLDDLKIAGHRGLLQRHRGPRGDLADGPVVVRCTVDDDHVTVDIVDRGRASTPTGWRRCRPPPIPGGCATRSGLGIPLMRTLTDEVAFSPDGDGTRVSLTVYRPPA